MLLLFQIAELAVKLVCSCLIHLLHTVFFLCILRYFPFIYHIIVYFHCVVYCTNFLQNCGLQLTIRNMYYYHFVAFSGNLDHSIFQ